LAGEGFAGGKGLFHVDGCLRNSQGRGNGGEGEKAGLGCNIDPKKHHKKAKKPGGRKNKTQKNLGVGVVRSRHLGTGELQ